MTYLYPKCLLNVQKYNIPMSKGHKRHSRVECLASGIRHQATDIEHLASGVYLRDVY